MTERDLRFTSAVLVIVSGLALSCSDWDAAVGVRCTEYPTFCRSGSGEGITDAGEGGTAVDSGAPSATDAGNGGEGGAPMTVSFARDIRPLMNRSETDPAGPGCSACHYTTTGSQIGILDGQLDMTTLGKIRRGGKTSGDRIIVPGDPDASALVQKLRGTYPVGSRMPWNGPPYWKDSEIQLVATWIAEGARGADDE